MSDRVVVQWRKKRNGCLVPEDRLRAALPGALILLPLSVLLSGVFTHYVPGTLGLALNMGCIFVSGIGVRTALPLKMEKLRSFFSPSNQSTLQADVVLTPIAAYNVDILHGRSAEAFAVTRYDLLDSRVQVHLLSFVHAVRRPVITMIAHFDTVSPHLRQRPFYPSSTALVCWRRTRLPVGLHG